MRAVCLLAWRNLSERPARTLLSAGGVILGVALLLAILIAVRSADKDLRAMEAGDAGEAALVVAPNRGHVSVAQALVAEVAGVDGVGRAIPQIDGTAAVPLAGEIRTLPFFGVDPGVEEDLRTYRLAEGAFPGATEPGVVIGQRFAAKHGLALGDTVTMVLGPKRRLELPITGLLAREGYGRQNGGGVLLVSLAYYQEALDRQGEIGRILVTLADGAESGAVEAAIADRLPRAATVFQSGAGSNAASLKMGLSFFGSLAVLVSAMLIFGGFSLALRQRTVQTGMTLAIGATPLQVTASLIVEALGIGLAGGLAAIPLGAALSVGMLRLVSASYNGGWRTFDRVEIALADIAVSLGVGLAVTLVAALLPAWRAARVQPVEALRAAAGGEGRKGHALAIAGLVLAVVGFFGWQWGIGGGQVMTAQGFTLGYFIGVAMAIPLIVRWSVRYLLEPVAARLGAVPRLAAGNLARNIDRATLTVSGMMVAVAMLISFAAISSSWWAGAQEHVTATMSGDLAISGDLTPESLAAARAVPGVAAVSPQGNRWIDAEAGWWMQAITIDPAAARQVLPFHLVKGDRDAALDAMEAGGALLISPQMAEQFGLAIGDTVRFERLDYRSQPIEGSFHELRVVGLISASLNQGRIGYISLADAEEHFGGAWLTRAYVKLEPGAASSAVSTALQERLPAVGVQDFAAVKAELKGLVMGEMSSFRAILYIALIMSALGIINTLTLSVIEQRRELALLRAVGATAGQTSGMVVVESLFLGSVGIGLGALAGAVFSTGFVKGAAVFMKYAMPFTFPLAETVLVVGAALALSFAAALMPAWRAGRVPVVEGLRNE